jgi:PEP-CTERM motif
MKNSRFGKQRAVILVVMGLCILDDLKANASVTYSDSTFLDANWVGHNVLDTTAAHNATFSAAQNLSGGNTGPYRETQLSYSSSGNGISQGDFIVQLMAGATYNPHTSGAITSLSFSLDSLIASSSGGTPPLIVGLVILQNGSYWSDNSLVNTAGSWVTTSEPTLVANDFQLIVSTSTIRPDFSTSGTLMSFGYITGSSYTSDVPAVLSLDTGADNFSVTVNGVPEPSSLVLLALGQFVLTGRWVRRGRRRAFSRA